MAISEALLPEFDQEVANTRRTLERIPDEKFDWKPHEKSMSLGGLATHLANLLTWTMATLENDHLDMAPKEGAPPRADPATSVSNAVATFDDNVAKARAAIASASDDLFSAPWTLLSGGEPIFTMPRVAVVRSFVMNHMIHHRAQLGVGLRLIDVPVPSVYGPTADETP